MITLYSSSYCPFVQRVTLAIKVRQITPETFQIRDVDLANPPAELLRINPIGSVPTLEFESGKGFNESLAIMQFMDTFKSNGPEIFGETPFAKGFTLMKLDHVNARFLAPLQNVLYSRGSALRLADSKKSIEDAFSYLEKELTECGGTWLGGNTMNALDISIIPFIYRYVIASRLTDFIIMPTDVTPKTRRYFEEVFQNSLVKETTAAPDQLKPILTRYLTPDEAVKKVLDASRTVLPEPEKDLAEMKTRLISEGLKNHSEPWKVTKTEKGFELQATLQLQDSFAGNRAVASLVDLQETTNHHTDFNLKNGTVLELILCTHEPRWGVTPKDLTFAEALIRRIS